MDLKFRSEGYETEPCIKPKHEQGIELAIVLVLIVPSMLLSFFNLHGDNSISFRLLATSTIFRDIGLLCLVLFFLWRNSEPVSLVGWRNRNLLFEVTIGILLFIPFTYIVAHVQAFLLSLGLSNPPPSAKMFSETGPYETGLAIVLVLIVAVTEETLFRGYLMLRFKNITESTTVAVIASSIIFSIGHGYEGSAGVVTVGVMGILFALVYLWRGTLIAPITMHFLQDFLGIVLLPWLAHHQ